MVPTLITTAAAVPPLAASAVEAALAPGAVEGFDSKAFDAALADTLALLDNAAGLVPSAFAKAPAEGDMAVRFPLLTPVIPEWVADADITVPLPAKGSATTGELELSEPADDAFDETTEVADVVVAAPIVLQPLETAVPVAVDTPAAAARDAESAAPGATPVPTVEAAGQRPVIEAAAAKPASGSTAEAKPASGSTAAPVAAAHHAQAADIHAAAQPVAQGQGIMPAAVPAAAVPAAPPAAVPAAPAAAVIEAAPVTPVPTEAAPPAVKTSAPVKTPAPAFYPQMPANAAADAPVAASPAVQPSQTPVIPGGQPPIAPPVASEYRPVPIELAAAINVDRGPDPSTDLGGQTPDGEGRPSSQFMRFAAVLSQVAASPEDGGRAAAPTFSIAAAPAAPAAAPAIAVAAPAPVSVPEVPEAENVGRLVQAMRVHTRAGAWEATVHLKPEHFGEVTIALRVEGKNVTASVQAESAGVRQWLESQEQAVRSGMAEHGLQLERFVVQRDGQQSRREAPQQDSRRRQPRRPPEEGQRFEIVV